jgi:hypothetical protein
VRTARAVLATVVIALGAVATSAAPAGAHGAGGLQPTNYRSRVLSITPAVTGLTVHSVDLGGKLELTNRSGHDVVVLGYDREPYLRVGPRGVFENARSPARYLNRTLRGTTRVPASADPDAPPQWRRIGDGPTVRWHDHRAHWTSTEDPPEVQRDPGSPHLVTDFLVQLRTDGRTVRVRGDVRWVPGPSPWGWLAGAAALALGLVIVGRTRRWPTALAVGLVLMIVAQLVHIVGLWGGSTASSLSQLGASAYALGGIAIAIVGLVLLVRRGAHAAVPLALLAGLFLALAGGLADVTTVSRSQVPTTMPLWLDRLAVAITLGAGFGTAAVAALHLRRERRAPVRAVPSGAASAVRADQI